MLRNYGAWCMMMVYDDVWRMMMYGAGAQLVYNSDVG